MNLSQPVYLEDAILESVTPVQVEAYMEMKGWKRKTVQHRWAQIWTREGEGPEHWRMLKNSARFGHTAFHFKSLIIQDLTDYAEVTGVLVVALAAYEGRIASDVLSDIASIDEAAWIGNIQRGWTQRGIPT